MHSVQQAALFQHTFTRRLITLLQSLDQWMEQQGGERSEGSEESQISLGVYLLEGNPSQSG